MVLTLSTSPLLLPAAPVHYLLAVAVLAPLAHPHAAGLSVPVVVMSACMVCMARNGKMPLELVLSPHQGKPHTATTRVLTSTHASTPCAMQALMSAVGSGGNSGSSFGFSPACVPKDADAITQAKATFAYAVLGPLSVSIVAVLLWGVRWLAVVGRNPVSPEPGADRRGQAPDGDGGPIAEGVEEGDGAAAGAEGQSRRPLASTGMAPPSMRSTSVPRRWTTSSNGAAGGAEGQDPQAPARLSQAGAAPSPARTGAGPSRRSFSQMPPAVRVDSGSGRLLPMLLQQAYRSSTSMAGKADPAVAAAAAEALNAAGAQPSTPRSPTVSSALNKLRRSMSLSGTAVAPLPSHLQEPAGSSDAVTPLQLPPKPPSPLQGGDPTSRAKISRLGSRSPSTQGYMSPTPILVQPRSAGSSPKTGEGSPGGEDSVQDFAGPSSSSGKDGLEPWDPKQEGRPPSNWPGDIYGAGGTPRGSVAGRAGSGAWLAGLDGADARMSNSSMGSLMNPSVRPTNLRLEVFDMEAAAGGGSTTPRKRSNPGAVMPLPQQLGRPVSPLGRRASAPDTWPSLRDPPLSVDAEAQRAQEEQPKKRFSLRAFLRSKMGDDVALVDSMVSLKRQLWMVALVAAFVLYPGWAQAGLQVFACRSLDPGADDEYGLAHLQRAASSYWMLNMNAVVSEEGGKCDAGAGWQCACVRVVQGGHTLPALLHLSTLCVTAPSAMGRQEPPADPQPPMSSNPHPSNPCAVLHRGAHGFFCARCPGRAGLPVAGPTPAVLHHPVAAPQGAGRALHAALGGLPV